MEKIKSIPTNEVPKQDINFMQKYFHDTSCEPFKQEINKLFHPFWNQQEKYNQLGIIERITTFIQEISDTLTKHHVIVKKENLKDFADYTYNKFYGHIELNEETIRDFNVVASRANAQTIKENNPEIYNQYYKNNNLNENTKFKNEFYEFFVDIALKYRDKNGDGILSDQNIPQTQA